MIVTPQARPHLHRHEIVVAVTLTLTVLFVYLIHVMAVSGAFANMDRPYVPSRNGLGRLLSVALAALIAGMAFANMRRLGWSISGGVMMVVMAAATAHFLYVVTEEPKWTLLIIGMAALVPAIRRVEVVGDVQASLTLGLSLAMLPMAGVEATLLILPLAFCGALADREARRSLLVFLSMWLVLVLPAVIVAFGIIIFEMRLGVTPLSFISPEYWSHAMLDRGDLSRLDVQAAVPYAQAMTPMLAYLVLSPMWHDRRHGLISVLVILLLPAYLEAGRQILGWQIPAYVPPTVFLACTLAYSIGVPLQRAQRVLVGLALLVTLLLTWMTTGPASDRDWRDAVTRPFSIIHMELTGNGRRG